MEPLGVYKERSTDDGTNRLALVKVAQEDIAARQVEADVLSKAASILI